VHGAAVPGHDGGHVHGVVAALRPVPAEVGDGDEERHEEHEVVERVPLPDALVRAGAEGQEVAPVGHVLPAVLREEPLERFPGHVRHQRRRRPVPDHLARHRLRVLHVLDLLGGDGLAGLGRPGRGHLGAHAGEHVRALGLPAGAHPRLAGPRARAERAHQPGHGQPRAPERKPGEVHGHGHEADVEERVVLGEPLPRLFGEIRPNEDRLGGLQVHVAAGHPDRHRHGPGAGAALLVEPPAEVGEDDPLLERGVGGESARGEVGRDPAAQVLVVLAEHVDEVVVAEELLPERVADEVEGVGPDVGEHAVGQLRVADEDDEAADEEVGGEPGAGLASPRRLRVPEPGRVADHARHAAEERHHERRAWQGALLAVVGELLGQEVERHRRRQERRQV
ncbi:hypothetical protein BRADI_2g06775v3, partial [Brachypodium distachyon]